MSDGGALRVFEMTDTPSADEKPEVQGGAPARVDPTQPSAGQPQPAPCPPVPHPSVDPGFPLGRPAKEFLRQVSEVSPSPQLRRWAKGALERS